METVIQCNLTAPRPISTMEAKRTYKLLTIQRIITEVTSTMTEIGYPVSYNDVLSKCRRREIVHTRAVIFEIIRTKFKKTLNECALLMIKDFETVRHARRIIENAKFCAYPDDPVLILLDNVEQKITQMLNDGYIIDLTVRKTTET